MPFINMKTTATLDIAKKDTLSKALCTITRDCIGKGENWVMTGFEGNASLCFLGSTKDIAYVEVKCYGYPTKPQMNLMTRKVCSLLETELGIPKKRIYVAYFPTEDWGWNDSNFQGIRKGILPQIIFFHGFRISEFVLLIVANQLFFSIP